MGRKSEREEVEDRKPSWMEPAATRLGDSATPWPSEEACTEAVDDPCKDSKDTITSAFPFMAVSANAVLDKLATDLKKVDKPDWQEALLEEVFDIALVTGGSLAGEYLVEHIGRDLAKTAKGTAELIKKSLEEGAPNGVKAALAKLGDNANPDVDEFISAQKVGVSAMYQNAARMFVRHGRHEITDTREAAALDASFSSANVTLAAEKQYSASLDAYLCSLAKSTLGVTKEGRTNMNPESDRDGNSGGHAPDISGAMLGIDKGVLTVQVLVHDHVTREPGVWGSYLNGVNETVREKYENVRLSMVKIPRQLVCSVRGDMPDFTVNVDEAGGMHMAQGSSEWLEARGRALRPDIASTPKAAQRRTGLDLLLGDLTIEKIGHGGFR